MCLFTGTRKVNLIMEVYIFNAKQFTIAKWIQQNDKG